MKKLLFVICGIAALAGCKTEPEKIVFDREIARSVQSVVQEPDGSVTFSIYALTRRTWPPATRCSRRARRASGA